MDFFSCLPDEDPLFSFPEEFTKIVSGRKLDSGVVSKQLMIEVPSLPDDLLVKDLAAKQNLLDVWNALAAFSIVSNADVEVTLGKALNAVSKGLLCSLCLQPTFSRMRDWHFVRRPWRSVIKILTSSCCCVLLSRRIYSMTLW